MNSALLKTVFIREFHSGKKCFINSNSLPKVSKHSEVGISDVMVILDRSKLF